MKRLIRKPRTEFKIEVGGLYHTTTPGRFGFDEGSTIKVVDIIDGGLKVVHYIYLSISGVRNTSVRVFPKFEHEFKKGTVEGVKYLNRR
jgi:hypothetical protein